MTGLVIALIAIAVVLGVIGLAVEALQPLPIIAGILLILGLVRAPLGRGSRTGTG